MHPALSVIVFTTFSGAGFGLIAWTGLGFGLSENWYAWAVSVLSGALVTIGLGSSALHLKRPDRAWRSFSQWRSSWLSREAVMAALTSAVFGLYALIWIFTGQRIVALGWLVAVLSAITVYTTSMIYAQLRTVPRWATPLTSLAYLAFAAAGGALAVAALQGGSDRTVLTIAFVALCAAWIIKFMWWRRAASTSRATAGGSPEAATGLGAIGTVRQFEAPHTGSNYLMKEMIYEIGRNRSCALQRVGVTLGAILPGALLLLALLGMTGPLLPAAAFILHLGGMLAERWLFFAEAEHVVGAYYGHR